MPPAAARFDHCKQDLRWKHDRTGGMVTVHPQHVSAAMLEAVDTALAVGKAPERVLQPFGRGAPVEREDGGVLAWSNGQAEAHRVAREEARGRPRREDAADDGGGGARVM